MLLVSSCSSLVAGAGELRFVVASGDMTRHATIASSCRPKSHPQCARRGMPKLSGRSVLPPSTTATMFFSNAFAVENCRKTEKSMWWKGSTEVQNCAGQAKLSVAGRH